MRTRPEYDVALICDNGHLINRYSIWSKQHNSKFCARCGAATSPACGNCQKPIKGGWRESLEEPSQFPIPKYCEHCGKPHVWTQKVIKAGEDLFAKLEGLSPEDREQLNKSIPDLIYETERTPEAALGIKQAMAKIEKGSRIILFEWLKQNGVGMVNRLFEG